MINIDEMPAGPEFDALIERVVMGIVWDESLCRVCGWPLSAEQSIGCLPGDCSLRPVPTRRADAPRPLSGDRVTALLIIDRMEALGYRCQLQTPLLLPTDLYRCIFRSRGAPQDESPCEWTSAETLALAIGRAAYKACEEHNEQNR